MDFKLNKEECIKLLLKNKYSLTNHREITLEILLNNFNKALNIEEIANEIRKIENFVNIATVYRNIQVFENLGLLNKFFFDNKVAYYKLCNNEIHHHHMICICCHCMIDVDFCPENDIKRLAIETNFKLKCHNFEILGYCENCLNYEN